MFERLTNSITFGQMFTKITLPLPETNFALIISTSGLEKILQNIKNTCHGKGK